MRALTTLFAAVVLASAHGVMSAPTASQVASAAAIVNGEEIPYEEYVSALETLPVRAQATGPSVAGAKTLDLLITTRLLSQFAAKEGVPVTDEQVEQRVQYLKKQSNVQAVMQSRYMTSAEFRREIKGQLAYLNLALKYADISDSEISDYYFKNKARFNQPLQVKVAAIVTPSKKKIDLAEAKLKQGADFASVVNEFSDDAITKANGGVLGWVWPNQHGVPGAIANTAAVLTVGTISRPIVVQGQWVILKALERKAPSPKPIEEARDEIRQILAVDLASRKSTLKTKILEFRKTSNIQILVKRFSKDLLPAIKSGTGDK